MNSPSPALELFLELAAIPSPPGEERAVADVVLRYLRDLGLEPDEDGCGPRDRLDDGEHLRAPRADGAPARRSSSARTSTPCRPRGRSSPSSRTASCGTPAARSSAPTTSRPSSQMLEGVRRVLAEGRPHAGIELLFTPKEEVGLIGAYAFDHDRLQRRRRLRLRPGGGDRRDHPRRAVVASRWRCTFHGRAAHSGMFPEEGRSAIQAAAKAIADLRLGRVDEETTANVGVISGGTAGNIVPEWCTFLAEARSQSEPKLARRSCRRCSTRSRSPPTPPTARSRRQLRKSYRGYRFKRDDDVVTARGDGARARAATSRRMRSRAAAPTRTSSTSAAGSCVNLANGMTDIHTPGRAHRRRGPRRDGRRDARARRRRARR